MATSNILNDSDLREMVKYTAEAVKMWEYIAKHPRGGKGEALRSCELPIADSDLDQCAYCVYVKRKTSKETATCTNCPAMGFWGGAEVHDASNHSRCFTGGVAYFRYVSAMDDCNFDRASVSAQDMHQIALRVHKHWTGKLAVEGEDAQ